MAPHRRGRWVIERLTQPFNSETPWKVTLWGGNGMHWADGAEVETYEVAAGIARQATDQFKRGHHADSRHMARFERDYLSD